MLLGLTGNCLKPACIIRTVCEQRAIDGRFIAAVTNKMKGDVRASTGAGSTTVADAELWQ